MTDTAAEVARVQTELARRSKMIDEGGATLGSDGKLRANTGWDANEVIGRQGIAHQNGQALAAFARTPAWHREGWVKEGDEPMTASEALEKAGLAGWNVQKRPLFAGLTDESKMGTIKVHNMFANVRTDIDGDDAYLGTVGHRYTVFQTEEVMGFLDELTGPGRALGIESAIALDNGRRVAISAYLPQDIILDPSGMADVVKPLLSAVNTFDGQGSFYSVVSPIRFECTNTVRWGTKLASAKWSVRHTTNGLQRIQEAQRQLGLMTSYYKAFETEATAMIQTPMSNGEFDKFLEEFYPLDSDASKSMTTRVEKKRGKARELFREADTNANIRNTVWAAEQALIEQGDWFSDVRAPKGVHEDVRRAQRFVEASDLDGKTNLHRRLMTLTNR